MCIHLPSIQHAFDWTYRSHMQSQLHLPMPLLGHKTGLFEVASDSTTAASVNWLKALLCPLSLLCLVPIVSCVPSVSLCVVCVQAVS